MAAFVKFNAFVENICAKVMDLHTGTTDVFKVMLTNTAPVATNSVKADLTEIAAGNGYTAGGNACTFTSGAQTTGTFKLVLADPATWTASGGTIGPFRYASLYDDTPTAPADPLMGFWDYGSAVTLQIGETFTVDLDGSAGVLTIT